MATGVRGRVASLGAAGRRHLRAHWPIALLAVLTAVVVWFVAWRVFPYHSVNHDEGVYLQQAAMLLEGHLYLRPPIEDAFRPWFFVDSPHGLYPKYTPVPAAMFAVGMALGAARLSLGLIAAGAVVACQRVVAQTFDERTGYVAAVLLLASPIFLVQSSVFLPYVPTFLLECTFAAAYLHADRTGSRRTAAVAGLSIGLAFFARPFTAILFATPFVAHALWSIRSLDRYVVVRHTVTASFGLVGVALALGYNAVVTGDPLVFPYEAFAPLDGLGYGRRELLGYVQQYTLERGIRTNLVAVWEFATRWFVAGLLGTIVVVLGVLVAVRRGLTARQATVAGLFVTVPVGNVYFWGTLNALGDLAVPTDGLAGFLGPYYHLDLLLPAVAFAAVGLRWVGGHLVRAVETTERLPDGRRTGIAVLVVLAAVGGGAAGLVMADRLGQNADASDQLAQAYEPFADRSLENGVVLLPTPHGDWLSHPLQYLRNDPGFDEGPIYALRTDPFAVLDAFPDRTAYRYVYHGAWSPRDGGPVTADLQRVSVTSGEQVTVSVSLGVPEYAERVSLQLSNGEERVYASTSTPANGRATATVAVTPNGARLRDVGDAPSERLTVGDRTDLELVAFVDYGTGAGFDYRLEVPVRVEDGRVQVLTPYQEVCRDVHLCGGEAASVEGVHPDYVALNVTVESAG